MALHRNASKMKQHRKRCPALSQRSRKTNLTTPATVMLDRFKSAEQPATQPSAKATDRRIGNKCFTPLPSPPAGKNPNTPWRSSSMGGSIDVATSLADRAVWIPNTSVSEVTTSFAQPYAFATHPRLLVLFVFVPIVYLPTCSSHLCSKCTGEEMKRLLSFCHTRF